MNNLATNPDRVYQVCDPEEPLPVDDPRYVDLAEVRGIKNIAASIARNIHRSDEDKYVRLLLAGHRGSGKSTELFRLQKALQDQRCFTVYVDTQEQLNLGEVTYLDVLLLIAKETESALRENNMPLPKSLLEGLSDWFAEKISEEQQVKELKAEVNAKAEAGMKIPFFAKLLARSAAEFKVAGSRRLTIREKLERELPAFVYQLNLLISAARNRVQKGGFGNLALIVDGLEKMPYRTNKDGISSHAELFVHHAEQLKSPACHVIYTLPVSLVYNANLGNDYDDIIVLPMIKTSEEGIAKLCQIVEKRVDINAVFSRRAQVEQLAQLSGGVIRDLMRLVRLSTDTDEEKITDEEIDYASKTMVREYDRMLRDEDLEVLRLVKKNKRVPADEIYARLLNLRLILEYHNGNRWADLHPALEQISWVRQALAAQEAENAGHE
ncbi:MAG: hypothetical protein GY862_03615 [Gammaproteobacteria bacterium]|nr:hypothetical protein [Gammaproteobacteria bacterium]